MGGGVVGMDGRMQRYSGHILPCWDGRGEEAEYVGKISGRVGFGLPRAHPILEDRFSHHIIISIPPSFVSEAWPSRSCSLGLPGGCTHGVQQGSRRYCTCCACAHADLEAGGLAGLKKSCPCHVQARLFRECASSYILTAWPCLKQHFDDAAISNCYSSITTLAVLGNETAWE